MNHLSLFSGIGGIDLAAEWAGFTTVAFCEQNKFCQQVLNKHWPEVPIYDDVRTLTAKSLGTRIKLISGGFPCQDLSLAGYGAGLKGERSGLWFEYYRLICEVRPNYVLVENVSALVKRGLDTVLGCLAEAGYDAEWDCISAADVGAPHLRERIFIVAYPHTKCGAERMGHIFDRAREIFKEAYRKRSDVWLQTPDWANRMDDGVSKRLYKPRVGALGNSVVPQVVYPILKAIADYENNHL